MKKLILLLFTLVAVTGLQSQTNTESHLIGTRYIKSEIYRVWYSEDYQQPVQVKYDVECPNGSADRSGMNFYTVDSVTTSDNADYANNVWDKGHMAPAADFNCTEEMLRMTFSYLNCALQHQGLNRGPWKELERVERELANLFAFVNVTIIVDFRDDPNSWLPTGALVPVGFTKIIWCAGEKFEFYFPNEDVSGQHWSEFAID